MFIVTRKKFISSISGGGGAPPSKKRRTRGGANGAPPAAPPAVAADAAHFGAFGGRYVPETLIEAHRELEEAYAAAKADPAFQAQVRTPPPPRAAVADADACEPTAACAWSLAQVAEMRKKYIGGPTPIYLAKRLTAECGGAQVAAV